MRLTVTISGDDVFGVVRIALPIVIGLAGLGARYWRFVAQWINNQRARDWAATSASIDVVSVAEELAEDRHGVRVVGYLGTLTYFYRNPELQVGEYTRLFKKQADAEAWVAQYKGRNVTVLVDPKDFSRSALLTRELDEMVPAGPRRG